MRSARRRNRSTVRLCARSSRYTWCRRISRSAIEFTLPIGLRQTGQRGSDFRFSGSGLRLADRSRLPLTGWRGALLRGLVAKDRPREGEIRAVAIDRVAPPFGQVRGQAIDDAVAGHDGHQGGTHLRYFMEKRARQPNSGVVRAQVNDYGCCQPWLSTCSSLTLRTISVGSVRPRRKVPP